MKSLREIGFRSSIVVPCVIVMALLSGYGWIYSRFPLGWYQETSIPALLSGALGLSIWAIPFFVICPPMIVIPVFALWGIVAGRPKKFSPKLISLTLPLLPGLSIAFWGAYWWMHTPENHMPRPLDFWGGLVISDLFNYSAILAFSILVYTLLAKSWAGERLFALAVLSLQLFYILELSAMAGMPVRNVWM